MSYDFIVFDTAPGIISDRALIYYNTVLLVTTPDNESLYPVVRLSNTYDKFKLAHNLVVNRFKNHSNELDINTIEQEYGKKVIGVLPEDDAVPASLAKHMPTCLANRNAPFSKSMIRLSGFYASKS